MTSSRHASGIAGNLVQTAFTQSDSIVHVEMSLREGMCIYMLLVCHAARSLLDSWCVLCEVQGRLWLGVTSHAWPFRRVGIWHYWWLHAQVTYKLFEWCEFSIMTNPLHKMRMILNRFPTRLLAMATKHWSYVLTCECMKAHQVIPQRLCKSLRQCMYWIAFLLICFSTDHPHFCCLCWHKVE